MTKRLITKHQEKILCLVHHDFEGLSQVEAARQLGISRSAISSALKRIKKILPNYFPILTKLEIKCYHHFAIEGWNVNEIAVNLGLTLNSVYKALQRAKTKGAWFSKPKGRILLYDPSMDNNIKKRF